MFVAVVVAVGVVAVVVAVGVVAVVVAVGVVTVVVVLHLYSWPRCPPLWGISRESRAIQSLSLSQNIA